MASRLINQREQVIGGVRVGTDQMLLGVVGN
jgi:hypothetical protein